MNKDLKITDEQLKRLSTKRGLKHLLYDDEINIKRALRFEQYEREIRKLQVDLVKLQTWVINNNKRVVILFEGRDAAGKGGAIRRFTHYLNPRFIKKVALPKPTDEERSQWYFQRYVVKLPDKGVMTFFDRSWYNRAIVEPVNGFCTDEEYEQFMNQINEFESMLIDDGITLIKFYFSITKEEQAKRFEEIKNNPLKVWKMSPVDERAQELWDVYTEYKNRMFEVTNTEKSPWVVIDSNRKTNARVAAIKHVLKVLPEREEYTIS